MNKKKDSMQMDAKHQIIHIKLMSNHFACGVMCMTTRLYFSLWEMFMALIWIMYSIDIQPQIYFQYVYSCRPFRFCGSTAEKKLKSALHSQSHKIKWKTSQLVELLVFPHWYLLLLLPFLLSIFRMTMTLTVREQASDICIGNSI